MDKLCALSKRGVLIAEGSPLRGQQKPQLNVLVTLI